MTLTNDFANGITWDDTNKRFVILTAGQYQINTQISWNNTSSASYLYTKILKMAQYIVMALWEELKVSAFRIFWTWR